MSGHSKWSKIKRHKGAQDAKRGKIFTKIIKEITVATRMGGSVPDFNPRLRTAILWAKSMNMPNDNISRAIKKGSSEAGGEEFVEIIYEGYGPSNTAILTECLTDNTNRSFASVRTIFNKNNGTLGAKNSVLFQFDKKGMISIPKVGLSEDKATEAAIEAGCDDISTDDEEFYIVTTSPAELHQVQGHLENAALKIVKSELTLIPQNTIVIDDLEKAMQVIQLIDALEEDDDVQKVYSNFDFSEDIADQL